MLPEVGRITGFRNSVRSADGDSDCVRDELFVQKPYHDTSRVPLAEEISSGKKASRLPDCGGKDALGLVILAETDNLSPPKPERRYVFSTQRSHLILYLCLGPAGPEDLGRVDKGKKVAVQSLDDGVGFCIERNGEEARTERRGLRLPGPVESDGFDG